MADPALRQRLLAWYGEHRRTLPWRSSPTPYNVWVSEIMLQQTQVATVIPYFERFIERFPDAESLAGAEEDDVLAMWSGLGYYRRARQLHAAAKQVVAKHDGELPSDSERLLALPGIGRYTAGAIGSIAFGNPTPILDGNVRRVVSRVEGFDADGMKSSAEERQLWAYASAWVEGADPGDFNQAMMELGATVCSPTDPACEDCPWRDGCRARIEGTIDSIPRKIERRASENVRVAVAVVQRGDKILLQRKADGPLRGAWDLPAVEVSEKDDAIATMERFLSDRHGLATRLADSGERRKHGILHRRLNFEILNGRVSSGRIGDDLRWCALDTLDETPISGATTKVLASL